MGRVGVVLGIEMSRLARTGRDWHQLLELCSLSGVLLADPDGVYDPAYYNDRLLLGLKGTMSEAELYLIRQRMLSGKVAKAERGELAHPAADRLRAPPVRRGRLRPRRAGAARRAASSSAPSPARDPQRRAPLPRGARGPAAGPGHAGPVEGRAGMAAPDPGDAAEHAAQPGLCRVLRLRPPPGRPAPQGPGPPGHRAGGERQRRVAGPAAGPASGLHHRGGVPGEHRPDGRQPADRRVPGRAAGRGRAAVRAAALRPLRRAPDERPLPRRIRLRPLRARLRVRVLPGQLRDRRQLPAHRRPGARRLRRPARCWTAVAPAALEVSMAAAAQAEDERAALDKLWRQRLERARYAADRARRQYQLAEPENRLVTRQLEADWESALAEAGTTRSRLPAVHRGTASHPDRGRAGGDPGPGRRPPAGLARPDDHAGRPQGTAAHPHRGHHRQRRRGQRAGRRHHHLGRRAPDHRAGRPPRRQAGPALVLPRAPRPRHRARRSRPEQPGRSRTS